jgi:DNA-binding LacI/PurR family transcriptional regulator
MEPRSGNLKTNFRGIARELDISAMTLYRVLNNSPLVRRETRVRVIDALNRHGYYTHKPHKSIKTLFDFTDHEYLTYYGKQLMRNISRLGHVCFSADHRKNRRAFLDAAAECDAAVFVSIPDSKIISEVRRVNPDIYTVTISTKSSADVTISPDNTRGGELAAGHLHANGHRHIAVHLSEKHPTRMERYKAFYAEMKLLDPDCRIDIVTEKLGKDTAEVLRDYFRRAKPAPTALFFLAGAFAEVFFNEFVTKTPERFQNLSIMTFDRPEDLEYSMLHYNFDRIEFVSRDLLDWAEYYITNRPMMKKRSPVHTSINVRLVTVGSVKNIKKQGAEQ